MQERKDRPKVVSICPGMFGVEVGSSQQTFPSKSPWVCVDAILNGTCPGYCDYDPNLSPEQRTIKSIRTAESIRSTITHGARYLTDFGERLPIGPLKEISKKQKELISKIEPSAIPTGAHFPLERIIESLSPGFLFLDLGCGIGTKTVQIAKQSTNAGIDGQIIGIDRNTAALQKIQIKSLKEKLPINAYEMDASELAIPANSIDGILASGLFCNLIAQDAQETAQQVQRVLKSGGRLYISDCLNFDGPIDKQFESSQIQEVQQRWHYRYSQNVQLGLPRGTFLVFKMGHKRKEYDRAENLQKHLQNPEIFERFARHWKKEELLSLFTNTGLFLEWLKPRVFRSRTNEFLLGINAIFQK